MSEMTAYAGLFLAALLAATVIPGSSEAALVALLMSERGEPAVLIAVATVGNVLGSIINWGCGRFLAQFRDRTWFPVSAAHYDRAIAWFSRYGRWSLLLAWAPIIGDPLTVAAGAMRLPLASFTLLVGIGKLARYLVVFGLTPG